MAVITNNISGSNSNGSKIGITGSVIISNTPDSQFPNLGTDAVFFVSGSESAKSVFGGAAKISGSLSTDSNVILGNSSDDIITVNGSAKFNQGLSGSLTTLADGSSYIIAGSNITVSSASNGAITIAGSGSSTMPAGADTYVQFNDGGTSFGGDSGLTYNKTTDTLTITGDLAVNGGDLTTTAATFNLLNEPTTLNIGSTAVTRTTNIATGTAVQTINIGTGAAANVISIGSATGAASLTLQAGATPSSLNIESTTGAIYIGNSTYARAIQLGTGLALQNVLIGSQTSASSLILQAGTGHVVLSGSTTTNYTIGSALGTGTITIGQSTGTNSILIGAGGTSTAAAQSINIGGGSGMTSITLGASTGASALTLQAGSGNLVLTGAAATTYTVGSTTGTGTLTLGRSTGANSILIGAAGTNTAVTQAINIGGGSGLTSITLGASTGASSLTLQAGSGSINIGTTPQSRITNIATGVAVQTVTLGSTTGASALILQAGTNYIATNTRLGINKSAPTSPLHVKCESQTLGLRLEENDSTNAWGIKYGSSEDLDFDYNGVIAGFLQDGVSVTNIDFTGQHRSLPVSGNINDFIDKTGFIVIASGQYKNLTSGSFGISINESLPTVELSTVRNQKSAFGVISDTEDPNETSREYVVGNWGSIYEKTQEDNRLIINSLGEGGIWICNVNGNLENGDYITTCEIPGYGMKQEDDIMRNYTVAKITCDCSFDLNSSIYKCEEFYNNGIKLIRAFVGCTYHCG